MAQATPPPRRPRARRLRRLRGLSVNALIPNAVTVMGLAAGISAIRFAIAERWELAVGLIFLAAVIDGLDGRIARVLKASSEFGAQLDSLSDFACFGVAPALVLFLWTLDEGSGLGWSVSLLFAICMALRLARFNAGLGDPDRAVWKSYYFTGAPAPAASSIVLLPMMLSFEFGDSILREPLLVAIYTIAVSSLTVSTIPMYSGKALKLRHSHLLPVLLMVGLLFTLMVGYPWHTLSFLVIAYICTIPWSIRSHRRYKEAAEANAEDPALESIHSAED
jgi:CDP-diacylglycerol--serine O-phosphatidyltransferase